MDEYKAETNQIDDIIALSNCEVAPSIDFYLNNIIAGIDLSDMFNGLIELLNSTSSILEGIEYKSEFLDIIAFIINALLQFRICLVPNLDSIAYPEMYDVEIESICKKSEFISVLFNCTNTIKLIWRKELPKLKDTLLHEGIVHAIISLLTHINQSSTMPLDGQNDQNIIYISIDQYHKLFSNMLEALSYTLKCEPSFLLCHCNADFSPLLIEVIIPLLAKSAYRLDSFSSRKFILSICENDEALHILSEFPDFFQILVPKLIQSLSLDKISEQSLSLFYILRFFGNPMIALSLESNLIPQIHNLFNSSYDQAEDYPILLVINILLRCSFDEKPIENPDMFEQLIISKKEEIINEFFNPCFMKFIHLVVAGHSSEPCPYLYEFIQSSMDIMWREFFNEGLILDMINYYSDLKSFANRLNDFKCILLFLEKLTSDLDEVIRHTPGTVQEIYDAENIQLILSQKTQIIEPDYPFKDDDEEEEIIESEEQIDLSSLSLFAVQASAIRDGALEILIDNFLSARNWQILKRSIILIHHLITQGPKEYAEIAYSYDIIDALESVQAELDNSKIDETVYNELVQIISEIIHFQDENEDS